MAPWNAREITVVGNSEVLGRRKFTHPELRGAAGQKRALGGLDTRDFLETRDRAISLDRLGRSGIDRKVINYLLPRAEAQAQSLKPAQEFKGWVCIQAGKLMVATATYQFSLVASPVPGAELSENDYHAHISYPVGIEPMFAALLLKDAFERHGSIRDARPVQDVEKASFGQQCKGLWRRLWKST